MRMRASSVPAKAFERLLKSDCGKTSGNGGERRRRRQVGHRATERARGVWERKPQHLGSRIRGERSLCRAVLAHAEHGAHGGESFLPKADEECPDRSPLERWQSTPVDRCASNIA